MNYEQMHQKSKQLRRDIITMITKSGSGHPGGSLSVIDILVALYYGKMRIRSAEPQWDDRDRFVLAKGHAAPALYAVLADNGYFDPKELSTLRQLHSRLQGHPDCRKTPGVDASTGSLGQGLSIACGMALGARLRQKDINIYAVLGDGELQEGQVWEAAMAAAHYHLDHLTAIIDNNGLQIDGANSKVMSLGNIKAKFESFGFYVVPVDGHDFSQLMDALNTDSNGKPKCILAKTIKGKGVSFMENQVSWHGRAPSKQEAEAALKELED